MSRNGHPILHEASTMPILAQEPQTPAAWPAVSFVVPAYNAADSIERTIQAVQQCEYPAFEIIVVDDGSLDDTAGIASQFPVRLIRHDRNLGLPEARNTGVRLARHDVVYLLDADCEVNAAGVRRLVARLVSDPHAGVVAGSYLSNGDPKPLAVQLYDVFERSRDFAKTPQAFPYVTCANSVVRKAAFEAVGGFDAAFLRIQDYDFTYRLHRAGFTNVHDPGAPAVHHNHRTSLAKYLSHVYLIGKYGTFFRLRNRPHAPFSRWLPSHPALFAALSWMYAGLFSAKIVRDAAAAGLTRKIIPLLPFVFVSRAVYTAGGFQGCREFHRQRARPA